jgi:hypothetical protein
MKTKLFLAVILAVGINFANAQDKGSLTPVATKGNKIINLGIGFGTLHPVYFGYDYHIGVPPVSVSAEYVFKDGLIDNKASIGAGFYVGFGTHVYEYKGSDYYGTWDYTWTYTDIYVGPRGYFHYQFVDKLDTYAGVFLGFNAESEKYTEDNTGYYSTSNQTNITPEGGGVEYSVFAGVRYYFTNNFAAMGEVGYGISYLNMGLALKF